MFLAITSLWLQRFARHSYLLRDKSLNDVLRLQLRWKGFSVEQLATCDAQQQCGLWGLPRAFAARSCGPGNHVQSLCEKGQLDKALEALFRMDQQGSVLRVETYRCFLKACTKTKALGEAKQLHAHLVKKGLESTGFLGESLVSTLVKCGSLTDALQVFFRLPHRTAFSWTAVISGNTQAGRHQEAVKMYQSMVDDGVLPNRYTFITLLKACGSMADLEEGKRIHSEALKYRCESDVFVGTCLVNMYAKCGSLGDAQAAFDGLYPRDVVSWTTMLGAYLEQGKAEKVLEMFAQLQEEGVSPDALTFVTALQACSSFAKQDRLIEVNGQRLRLESLKQGKVLHGEAKRRGCDTHVFVGNALISMYGRCGSIMDAQKVFDGLVSCNDVSWNAMLAAFIQQGQPEKALKLYGRMALEGFSPDALTIVSALQACGSLAEKQDMFPLEGQLVRVESLLTGKGIHAEAQRKGHDGNVFVGSSLVSMYAKCGSIVDAQHVFDTLLQRDMVSWNAMLAGYAQQGDGEKALQLYHRVLEEVLCPDDWTFVSAAQACGSLAEKESLIFVDGHSLRVEGLVKGKELHAEARRRSHELNVFVGNALVSMYGKCGSITDAQIVFDGLMQRDVVSWNAMLTTYAQQGLGEKGLQLYVRMQQEGVAPNETTFMCILQACSTTGSFDSCTQIHCSLVSSGNHLSSLVASTLIHAYGKCGRMADARKVFDALPKPDVSSWNALIAGYSRQGHFDHCFQCYERMLVADVRPNAITFSSLLSACSHAGLMEKGVRYFECMSRDHGIIPDIQHYGSLVDLLGRAGYFTLVEDLLLKMPTQCDLSMWMCLLHACRKHGNVVLGKRAFDCAVSLQPKYASAYVLMSQIYDQAGMCDNSRRVEESRQIAGAWKNPGQSWVELQQGVQSFFVGEHRSRHEDQICYHLLRLSSQKRDDAFLLHKSSIQLRHEKD